MSDELGSLGHALRRLQREPHLLLPAFIAWLNGWRYKIWYALLFKKFKAGPMFRVYGKLIITGPGTVEFGRNCLIISNAIKPVCIRTLSPQAKVSLGDSAGLNGSSLQCSNKIEIGGLTNIADAYITDSSAHGVGVDRRQDSIVDQAASSVVIGKNVWVSVQVVILHGVTIGDNSVIGAASLVRGGIPANSFMAGNPLRLIRKIDE
jgi:acetyltransferase-like isoleucine patch superfamily enzyme